MRNCEVNNPSHALLAVLFFISLACHTTASTHGSAVALSADFVQRIIDDQPVAKHLAIFRDYDPDALARELETDAHRLAFWINLYNGYTQYFLKTDPTLYLEDRGAFFKKKQIPIAGYVVSMEDIEHRVLRRGATIFSLGYIRALWFRDDFAKHFAVDQVDYRIHFALNCGARSCPPVVAYRADTVDTQLDDNSKLYLEQEVRFEGGRETVRVPRLMLWFHGDFGGRKHQLTILRRFGLLAADESPDIDYLPYDWSLHIRNYRAAEG